MEIGKLTAKLRDAVPVCFLVEGKEIKRYKNIDIPDELKKLEYQGFKFDVPTIGPITFKISFAPGILPEKFPKERARSTRTSKDTPVVVIGETPDVALSEKAIGIEAVSTEAASEPTQETAALIIIEEDPVVEILENATLPGVIEESTASSVELQTTKEAMTEAKTETEIKDTAPTKKATAKLKKAPETKKCSKE